ncbi:MAG: hypothetical protein IJU45_09525, partial [Clostridia bacterium]|nr:hypothetical protein [Clostridia bacterium]
IDNIKPQSEDLINCKEHFTNYINGLPEIKPQSNEELVNNNEFNSLLALRQQTDDTKESLEITSKMFEIAPNNSSVVKTYALLLQDYAIELYNQYNIKTEDEFLKAIEMYFRLLSFSETSKNKSDIYYKIAQCYDYLSLINNKKSSRNNVQDEIIALTFYQFSYESVDYENANNYSFPHAMAGIVAHRIAKSTGYNKSWSKLAYSEYELALDQLPCTSKYQVICSDGQKELKTILYPESSLK